MNNKNTEDRRPNRRPLVIGVALLAGGLTAGQLLSNDGYSDTTLGKYLDQLSVTDPYYSTSVDYNVTPAQLVINAAQGTHNTTIEISCSDEDVITVLPADPAARRQEQHPVCADGRIDASDGLDSRLDLPLRLPDGN